MKKKAPITRGLAAVMVLLLFISVSASTLMFANAGIVNNVLNVSTSKVVETGSGENTNTIYYDNPYGTDVTDRQATMNMEMAVAAENITQAEEGAVLLRNENSALPLSQDSRVTVFGNGSVNSIDSASGAVDSTAFESIPAVGFVDALQTALGSDQVNTTLAQNVYSKLGLSSNSEVTEAPIADVRAYADSWQNDYNDAALVVFSRAGSEGNDSAMTTGEGRHYLGLSQNEEDLMAYLKEQKEAGVFSSIVAVINSDQIMELDWLERYDVDACLLAGLPGAVGFTGIANVLVGNVTPSGHLVDTYAANSLSAPAITYAAENAMDWSNSDWIMENCADNNGDGTNILHYTIYAEGIYVGYKYYETRYEDTVLGAGNASDPTGSSVDGNWDYGNEVVFPFGYGLSYTTFQQELLGVTYDADSDEYTVQVQVTNTGDVAGKSVAQIYAQTPYGDYEKQNLVEKAAVQLVGFEKTGLLEPGASETLDIPVERYFLASYDSHGAQGYILSAGDYYLALGNDAHDALNNVLAAKGYTSADGMTADGDAAKTYSWTQDALDTESYRQSRVTDQEVTNAFDHADLNDFGIDMDYLSRSDWAGTYPVEAMQLEMNDALLEDLSLNWYEQPADAPEVSDFTQGAQNGLTFSDMRLVDWDDEETWDKFIDQLTVEEMASMLMDSRGTAAIESIAMPAAARTDDNGGIGPLISEGKDGIKWVTEVMTSRTWNKERFSERGRVMAIEATFCGLTEIWYGGGNIHRTPVGGRNWQYYSEDGNFGYIIGAYEAAAMQAQGVIYCPKHFALNDQETYREGISTFANEQSIREIYLRAFEGAICEGGALGIMTSFNRLGCRFASANYNLVHTVLKGEWGFQGHATTDGYTTAGFKMHFREEATAGIDYTCASTSDYGDAIAAAVADGDGFMLQKLRETAKHNIYAISRTIAQNGLSSNTTVVTVVPWWETALLALTAVSGLGFVICTGLTVASVFRKKSDISVEEG